MTTVANPSSDQAERRLRSVVVIGSCARSVPLRGAWSGPARRRGGAGRQRGDLDLAVVEQIVLARVDTVPIGIPGGYSDCSGPGLKPAVTTCLADVSWNGPVCGRSWTSSWLGSPTAGTSTPVSPSESWIWAATAIEWSVISVTIETVGSTVEILPTSAAVADHRVVEVDAVVGALVDLDRRVPEGRVAADHVRGDRRGRSRSRATCRARPACSAGGSELRRLGVGELRGSLFTWRCSWSARDLALSVSENQPATSRDGLERRAGALLDGRETSTTPRCTVCSGLLGDSPK